jgi:hypothetical protein
MVHVSVVANMCTLEIPIMFDLNIKKALKMDEREFAERICSVCYNNNLNSDKCWECQSRRMK